MSLPRFHIPHDRWNPDDLLLDDSEAHHCIDVLRCKQGDKVIAFNGKGVEAMAEITGIGRRQVALRRISLSRNSPPPAQITLGQAIPKGKNMDLIIQKATELGAQRIVPLLSDRSVIRLDRKALARKQDKWQRVALEASKQSGQNWLPTIDRPQVPAAFFSSPGARFDLMLLASLQPDAVPFKQILAEHLERHGVRPASTLVLIGPEGDFTPAEIAQAKTAGCLPFTLGPIILRTETAALYSLSVLAHELY